MSKQVYLAQTDPRGYQWPASALTGAEMAILNDWRAKTGTPICQLVKQAIKVGYRGFNHNPLKQKLKKEVNNDE